MWGFFRKHKRLALSLLVLAFLVVIVGASASFQNCIDQNNHYQGAQGFPKILSSFRVFFFHCPGEFLRAASPVIEAFSTLAIAFLAYFTWRATQQQSKSTDELSKATVGLERPYLFVDRVKINRRDHLPSEHNTWFISYQIKNVGRAPAWIEECRIALMDKTVLPETPDYSAAIPSPFVQTLAPGRGFWTHEIGPAPPVEKDGKAIEFVVYGKILYRDLMGNRHETRFASDVSPHMPVAGIWGKESYNSYD